MNLEIISDTALRVLLVGSAAWLVLRARRVRNPHAETLLWRLLLLSALVMPALLFWQLGPNFETTLELPLIGAEGLRAVSTRAGAAPSSALTLLAPIYLVIAALLLGRLAAGLVVMWRVIRAARPIAMPDDVRISKRILSPATFGTIILLPADAHSWPAARLDAVLTHERAHVRWHDGHWMWLARIHTAIFWFSPFAWWLQKRLETLAEITSDDAVIAARHDPVAYAALLLDFARHPNARSVVMSVAESNVPHRIERLLARTPAGTALPRAIRLAAFALFIPVAVLAACSTHPASPAKPATASAPTPQAAIPAEPTVRLVVVPNPDDFYPPLAEQEKISGYAVLEVAVDPVGQLKNVAVLKAEPADPRYGIAAAAVRVAQNTQYENSGHEVASLKFMVKFTLED